MSTYSEEKIKNAIDFCNDFGRASEKLESFFKGFIYLLTLRQGKDGYQVEGEIKKWEKNFDFFLSALTSEKI
jgi:hypothetical protein